MFFFTFFISFLHSFKSGVLNPGFNTIYNIYLDNPKNNIYFPFKKVKTLNLDILKEICSNLDFLSSFLHLNRIVINYNILYNFFILVLLYYLTYLFLIRSCSK